jgi:hypothetical protein
MVTRIDVDGGQHDNLWALVLDDPHDSWHVREQVTPLGDGVIDPLPPCHDTEICVRESDVFSGLVELGPIPADHAVEAASLSSEIDHPVRYASIHQCRVEYRQVNVLDSVIGDFEAGRKVLV